MTEALQYLSRQSPVPMRVFNGWVAATDVAVYTFNESGKRLACIARARFCNTDAATARTLAMRIVPTGGTITDDQYSEVDPLTGGAIAAGNTLYYEEEGGEPSMFLYPGDRIVLLASLADVIAAQIWIKVLA